MDPTNNNFTSGQIPQEPTVDNNPPQPSIPIPAPPPIMPIQSESVRPTPITSPPPMPQTTPAIETTVLQKPVFSDLNENFPDTGGSLGGNNNRGNNLLQEADQPKIKQKRNTRKIITAVFVFLFLVGAPLLAWQLGVFRGDIRQRASEGTTVTLSQVSLYGGVSGATSVSVSGNYAYVVSGDCLKIIDVSNLVSPLLVAYYNFSSFLIDPLLFVSGDYAYVVGGGKLITINVSNPSSPTLVADLVTNSDSSPIQGVFVSGNYAYVGGVGYYVDKSAFRVFDISNPSSGPTLVGEDTVVNSGLIRGIFVSGNYAYVGGSAFRVFDISNPSSPTLKITSDISNDVKDVFVSGNYAYVSSGKTLKIVDISNPLSPTLVASYDTPNTIKGVFVSGNYAYVGGGQSAGLSVIDVSTPSSPTLVASYDTPGGAWKPFVVGSYVYVPEAGKGLRILKVEIKTTQTPTTSATPTTTLTPTSSPTPTPVLVGVTCQSAYLMVSDGAGGWRTATDEDKQTLTVGQTVRLVTGGNGENLTLARFAVSVAGTTLTTVETTEKTVASGTTTFTASYQIATTGNHQISAELFKNE